MLVLSQRECNRFRGLPSLPHGGNLQVGVVMRLLVVGGLVGCLAAGALAQHRRTYGSPSGFGNILFPGTGTAPRLGHPFSITDPTFAGRLSATISGFPPYTGAPVGPYRGRRYAATWPLMYPLFVGGYYWPDPAPAPAIYPPAQAPPQVVINQYFTGEPPRPAEGKSAEESKLRIYEAPVRTPAAEPAEPAVSFLIATTDRSVFSASAYWVEGDTLHYVTPRGKHEQIPLAKVDRQLSEKLNEGHQVEFRLPPAK